MVSGHPQTETFTCRSHAGPMLCLGSEGRTGLPLWASLPSAGKAVQASWFEGAPQAGPSPCFPRIPRICLQGPPAQGRRGFSWCTWGQG